MKHIYRHYAVGYGVSLMLTIIAAWSVMSGEAQVYVLVGLAVIQIVVQALYFLHLGRDDRPQWRSVAFVTMVMVVIFIVAGSIWIMNNLNYNMTDHRTIETMIDDEGVEHQ